MKMYYDCPLPAASSPPFVPLHASGIDKRNKGDLGSAPSLVLLIGEGVPPAHGT